MISIKDLNKADVLAALYNGAAPRGLGFMHYSKEAMTREQAQALLDQFTRFDYVHGRVLKVDLGKDEFDPWLYDRDNGEGAAQRIIDALRAGQGTNPGIAQKIHEESKFEGAVAARKAMEKETRETAPGILELGAADVKDQLKPAVDKAMERDIEGQP